MALPLVSAVVPVHNGERFLAAALDSVLFQDYEPLEVIVVDDGSTDRSAEVASSRPVRLLRQENAGMAAARNAGIAHASGELVAFIDADDEWLPEAVARQAAVLAKEPSSASSSAGWSVSTSRAWRRLPGTSGAGRKARLRSACRSRAERCSGVLAASTPVFRSARTWTGC